MIHSRHYGLDVISYWHSKSPCEIYTAWLYYQKEI